jgi:hypothetical protein
MKERSGFARPSLAQVMGTGHGALCLPDPPTSIRLARYLPMSLPI